MVVSHHSYHTSNQRHRPSYIINHHRHPHHINIRRQQMLSSPPTHLAPPPATTQYNQSYGGRYEGRGGGRNGGRAGIGHAAAAAHDTKVAYGRPRPPATRTIMVGDIPTTREGGIKTTIGHRIQLKGTTIGNCAAAVVGTYQIGTQVLLANGASKDTRRE